MPQGNVGGDELTREFSDAERRDLRKMLIQQQRMQWMWATLRIWIGWTAAAAAGAYGIWSAIREMGITVSRKVGGS